MGLGVGPHAGPPDNIPGLLWGDDPLLEGEEGFIAGGVEGKASVLGGLPGQLGDGVAAGLVGRQQVADLQQLRPRRRLRLVPVDLLDDLVVVGGEPSLQPEEQTHMRPILTTISMINR